MNSDSEHKENHYIKQVRTITILNQIIGILYAEAEGSKGLPIPVKCKWFRFKNERAYQIEEINSNVYQLSAEDIGCVIRVEATPVDADEF